MSSSRSRLVLIAVLATTLAAVTTAQDHSSDALYVAIGGTAQCPIEFWCLVEIQHAQDV